MIRSIQTSFCKFGFAALLAAAFSLSAYAHCGTCGKGDDKEKGAKHECKACDKKDAKKCDKDGKECAKAGFIVSVEGMTCPACEAKVKKALEGVKGVKSAKACHKAGKACVVMADEKGALSKEDAEKALAGTDFKVTAVAKCEAGKCEKGKCDKKEKKEDKKEEKKA